MQLKTKIHYLIFVLFFCFSSTTLLKSQSIGGLASNAAEKAAYQRLPVTKINTKANLDFFSLRAYAPTPYDQKNTPTCVPLAIMYGASSIMLAQQNGWKNTETTAHLINENALSGLFGYAQTIDRKKYRCSSSLGFMEVFDVFSTYGTCKHRNYLIELDAEQKQPCFSIDEKQLLEAKLFKIGATPERLFDQNTDATLKIEGILAQKRPVVVGLKLFKDYTQYIQNGVANFQEIALPQFGHAVVIIGFKKENGQTFFEIMDSRGTTIGDNGFWWITAQELEKRISEAFNFKLINKRKTLNTEWNFINPMDNEKITPVFRFNETEKAYIIQKKDWKGDIFFKTQISGLRADNFVYMLYYSPSSLPRFDHFDTQNPRIYQAIYEGDTAYFPAKTTYQKDELSKTEEDYLIFLYSYQAIDISKTLTTFNASPSGNTVYQTLEAILGKDLVKNVIYHQENRMGCEVIEKLPHQTTGNVIPIIIKFEE